MNAQDSALQKSLELEELLEKLSKREAELVAYELSSSEAQEAASSSDSTSVVVINTASPSGLSSVVSLVESWIVAASHASSSLVSDTPSGQYDSFQASNWPDLD